MLRIIHTADVHLGARHDDLGEQAAAQRERQFAAFTATVDLALTERVDLVLIAGDLFDSNVQPRRSVERVAAELARLVQARIRTVIIPGTHDVYDRASIYRAYDLKTLAGSAETDDFLTVLTTDLPAVYLNAIDTVVHGRVFATKRAPNSPLQGFDAATAAPGGKWRIGMIHGSLSIPGKTDRDEVVFTIDEIAASHFDYLALGHWHSSQQGRSGGVTYAYSGAPEPVALDQDRAGKVLLVELDEAPSKRIVTVEERVVGRTRFDRTELDAATVKSQPTLIERSRQARRSRPRARRPHRGRPARRPRPRHRRDRIAARPLVPQGPRPRPLAAGADQRHAPVAGHRRGRLHPRPRGTDRRLREGGPGRRGRRAPRLAAARSAPARGPRGLVVRIRRLQLKEVRRYRELDIELAPGLTVVRGPNEAGKTTIQRAIELAITRRATSAAGDLESLRPWDAAPEARSVVRIEFEQDEEDGQKRGSLEKTFAGSRGTVALEYDGQSIDDPTLADQVIAELTGIPTEGFFRATASIRHQELDDVTRDEASLRDRLQASISGGDRGTSRARKKLDKAIYDLATKGEKNPGRLKVAEQAVAKAQTAVEQGDAALAQLASDRDALAGAHDRRAETEVILAERRSMLEKARQAERLVAERDAAQERYERYRQAVEVTAQLEQLAATHPSANPLPVVRAGVERLRALDVRARELRAALAGEGSVTFEVPPEPTTWRSVSRISMVMIVVGLLITVAAVAANLLDVADLGMIPAIAGGIIAGIGLILGGVAVGQRRSYSMGGQLRDTEIDRRLRGRSEMEAELAQVVAETARRLQSLGLEDLAAAETLLAAEEAHVGQIDRLTAQRDGLVGKEPPETLTQVRDAAALEVSQKGSAIDALGPIAKEPRARERLEVEVRDQEAALERTRDDEANARARVEANTVDAEQVAGQAERLAMWREQYATLERRKRVYDLTLASIDRAEQATMKTATRFLEQRMVGDLSIVTGGRYRHVRVDDRTLDIEVRAPEKRDWVKVTALSQGTMDLVYLTARLGLVRLVTGDRRPPLILDDPFVTLDDERATRALELLRAIATDFQVIYLTTSDRYDRVAAAVVELPGPTLVDDAPPPVAEPPAAPQPTPPVAEPAP